MTQTHSQPTKKIAADFQRGVLDWYDAHGRKHLPWQNPATPYTVWISEVMLQQTQVATVIPYFEKFMASFPDVYALASAEEDEVLHHWSGLGYYARARNLHKCAKQILENYRGHVPDTLEELERLSGIGRSTAGAVLSLGHKQYGEILDGNVKRVLARCFAIEGWVGKSAILKNFWRHAQVLTPDERTDNYNQAMMDLGATVCTRSKPACESCPLSDMCVAHKSNRIAEFPFKKPKKKLPVKSVAMLVLKNCGRIYLERRASVGIWGGLWSLPEFESVEDMTLWLDDKNIIADESGQLPEVQHKFSHYQLNIQPYVFTVSKQINNVMENDMLWYESQPVGLPAPVSKIVKFVRAL